MNSLGKMIGTACAAWLVLAANLHAADAKLWKTYCDDATKSAEAGRFTDANQFANMALVVAEQFGEADQRLIETLFLAAGIQEANKQFAEAEPHLRRALALREAKLGTNDINAAECAFYLGQNLCEQRKSAEADALLKRVERILKWKTSSYHPVVGICQAALARNSLMAGRFDEADKLYTSALRILGTVSFTKRFTEPNRVRTSLFVPDYPRVMQIRMEHAQTLHAAKKYKDAEEAYKKLVKLIEDVESKDSILLKNPLLAFAEHYADVKKYPAAEALLLRRQAIITKAVGETHPEHLKTMAVQQRIYREQGKTVEADALAKQLAEAGMKPAPAK